MAVGGSPGPLLLQLPEAAWGSQAMPQNLISGTGLGRPFTEEVQGGVDSNQGALSISWSVDETFRGL